MILMDKLLLIFECIAVSTYGILGAMTGIKKKMDMFGTITLGVVTALGGGVIRDVILGRTPPVSFVRPIYFVVAALSAAVVLIPGVRRIFTDNNIVYDKVMFVLDTLGLALFTEIGLNIAEGIGDKNLYLTVFVAVITGVGGGVVRDMFSCTIPKIFVKHIYACASIAGAIVSAVLWEAVGKMAALVIGFAVICIIRVLSARNQWELAIK